MQNEIIKGKITELPFNILNCLLWGSRAWQSPRAVFTVLGTPCYKSSLASEHCIFVPSFLEVIISLNSGGYLGYVSLNDLIKKMLKKLLKIHFHFASVLGQLYRLGQNNLYDYQVDRSRDQK